MTVGADPGEADLSCGARQEDGRKKRKEIIAMIIAERNLWFWGDLRSI